MRKIRGVLKVSLLTSFILVTYVFYLAGYLSLKVLRMPWEPWRNVYMRNLSKGLAYILNLKIQTIGTPPEPSFILVSNHLSYIDILPMFMNLKCTFVAKKEVRSWPVLGFMVMTMGVIFIDRNRKRDVNRVNRIIRENLNENQGIVLFPEGTTTGGEQVLPFRSSLLDMPASEKIPVHYSAIQYKTHKSDPPADRSVCFYGARDPFHTHLFKLACNRRVEATVVYGEHVILDQDRKELARRLHAEVERASMEIRRKMEIERLESREGVAEKM